MNLCWIFRHLIARSTGFKNHRKIGEDLPECNCVLAQEQIEVGSIRASWMHIPARYELSMPTLVLVILFPHLDDIASTACNKQRYLCYIYIYTRTSEIACHQCVERVMGKWSLWYVQMYAKLVRFWIFERNWEDG